MDETNIVKDLFVSFKFLIQSVFGTPLKRYKIHVDYSAYKEYYDRNNMNEVWYFINGMCTNEEIIKINCEYLSQIFKRTIIGLHNPTNGFLSDFVECIIGRSFDIQYKVMKSAAKIIENELKTRKVKIIAHSQGGIIMSDIIDFLTNSLLVVIMIYWLKLFT
jgi:hypothetical protein